jgi:hypothetical protein
MSKLTEQKLDVAVQNKGTSFKLKTAYDYLNQLTFTVNGTSDKSIDLLFTDAICLLGNSRITNVMLTKIAVHCLMPKKYGGFGIPKVFVLDAGNCTDVYQFVDFMKQYGLNIKKNLKKIMISRVFTVYQLTHFLKYELPKTIHEYKINKVIIPNLLEMFFQEAEIDVDEVEFLVTEVTDVLKVITNEAKVLLITSLSLDEKLPSLVVNLGNRIVKSFNKCIRIDKNKTNDKFKMLIQQKQDEDYVTVKKYLSITAEDVFTVIRR